MSKWTGQEQRKSSIPGARLSLIVALLQQLHQTGQLLHPEHAKHAPPALPAVRCKHKYTKQNLGAKSCP